MAQGPKNLRVSFSAERLTHFGGLVLLQQFIQALDLRRSLCDFVRFEQRNNRYTISESFLSLLYPVVLGLGRIETTRLLRRNGIFQYLTGLPTYPDPQTLRRFLARFGGDGLRGFLRLHDRLRSQMVQRPQPSSTFLLDLDTTVLTVYGHQEKAEVGYNPKKRGRPSYLPLLCFEGQTRDCWEASYHPGNTHPGSISEALLERAFAKIPEGVREVRVRADSAFYDRDIMRLIEGKKAFYAIVARLTKPLKERVAAARYRRVSGLVYAADFLYQPKTWKSPRRFVAIRRPVPEEPTWQMTLWRLRDYTYQVLVTNLDLAPLNLWRFYNQRARAELIIRELKEAYDMGKIPTGLWEANTAYFHLTVFAYNLLNWFKRLCVPPAWQRLTLQSLRNRLLLIPAELVRPHGTPVLKMPKSYPHQDVFLKTLRRIAGLRLT